MAIIKVTVIKMANPFQNKSDDSSFMIEMGVLLEIFGATFDPWISEPAYELPAWNEKKYELLLHFLKGKWVKLLKKLEKCFLFHKKKWFEIKLHCWIEYTEFGLRIFCNSDLTWNQF